ncbi:type II toxin-antitoxin system BrnA family antitoxin [Collinsella intestinalis]|uniref:type II toxin-antitoxin system BrnA family antitoxin n=1 Tax=Collinsella intestinalis TaxID=147207 RepID=UPI001959D1BE|nr:hypothetical protein [Collinsella intestinalis]MBM6942569.1 CopG family transcriptional regulator [Collinsella intestinalis]
MKTFSSSEEMERVFDTGEESILDYADMSTLKKPGKAATRRVALDMNSAAIARLDSFAERYGVSRQALIKVWLMERMDEEDARATHLSAPTVV